MTSDPFERFVFIELPGEREPVPAGLFTLDLELGVGTFQYGRRYLERSNSVAIDPVNLPLSDRKFVTQKNGGIFGILRDALPDSWGCYLMSKQQGVPFGTLKDHELIDLISTCAVGAISFGLTPKRSTTQIEKPYSLDELGDVASLVDHAVKHLEIPPEMRHLFSQGTSLGGAQPKWPVIIDDEEWIAKFESSKTMVKYPALEFATMTMAAKAGIRVPEIRLEMLEGRAVYLIKRFDRENGRRMPFMSAFALSDLDVDEIERGSYPEIANRMRRFVANVRKDHHELFRRIAFNMMVRNEDDHLRNHGFLCRNGWQLSPAYDILPLPARRREGDSFNLALDAGDQGPLASLDNLYSQCERYSLDRKEAIEIVSQIKEVVKDWEAELIEAGVSKEDREKVRWCFEGQQNW